MKTSVFDLFVLDESTEHTIVSEDEHIYFFTLPIIKAYAIESFELRLGFIPMYEKDNVDIEENGIRLKISSALSESTEASYRLIINYHGIRDYSLLFPKVSLSSLRNRLGEFYREAEFAFESSSWLSFMLMCGAIFEGMLFDKYPTGNDKFQDLIERANADGLISDKSKDIMNNVRAYRNRIHGRRHVEPYVTRSDAMDTRIVLDKLILAG